MSFDIILSRMYVRRMHEVYPGLYKYLLAYGIHQFSYIFWGPRQFLCLFAILFSFTHYQTKNTAMEGPREPGVARATPDFKSRTVIFFYKICLF